MSKFTDIRNILAFPSAYSLFARLIGGTARSTYVNEYIRPSEHSRILDIGCGPGDILEYLPTSVEYLGFDINEKYIEAAKNRFGERGIFLRRKLNKQAIGEFSKFDIVLATGVLHHLEDEEAVYLFQVARSAMKPTGRLVTLDGCFVAGQSPIAKYLVARDRGSHVRTEAQYTALASEVFPSIKTSIRHDLMRVPYTHIIMECKS